MPKVKFGNCTGWISDSSYSLKPLWSGMGEVVPTRTSPTLHPPSPHCASIVATSTLRVKTTFLLVTFILVYCDPLSGSSNDSTISLPFVVGTSIGYQA